MRAIIKQTNAALISTFLMLIGHTAFSTAIPLRLKAEGYSTFLIGCVAASYYVGMLFGSFKIEPIIQRLGHIRAFALFASGMGVITLLPPIVDSYPFWIICRCLAGLSLAGLYIVMESWFVSLSAPSTRGQYLGLYMMSLSIGAAIGPLFINIGYPTTLIPFCLASLFFSCAIWPMLMYEGSTPQQHQPSILKLSTLYKYSPAGFIGCIVSGILISSFVSMLPIVVTCCNITLFLASVLITISQVGGIAFQMPVGKLSDRHDRRLILMGLCLIAIICCIISVFYMHDFNIIYIVCIFIIGGITSTTYPLSINLSCENIPLPDITKGMQSLMLAYGSGAVMGPIITSRLMDLGHSYALFLVIATACALYAIYLMFNISNHSRTITSIKD